MIKLAATGSDEESSQIILVQNWHQELLERVPIN